MAEVTRVVSGSTIRRMCNSRGPEPFDKHMEWWGVTYTLTSCCAWSATVGHSNLTNSRINAFRIYQTLLSCPMHTVPQNLSNKFVLRCQTALYRSQVRFSVAAINLQCPNSCPLKIHLYLAPFPRYTDLLAKDCLSCIPCVYLSPPVTGAVLLPFKFRNNL